MKNNHIDRKSWGCVPEYWHTFRVSMQELRWCVEFAEAFNLANPRHISIIRRVAETGSTAKTAKEFSVTTGTVYQIIIGIAKKCRRKMHFINIGSASFWPARRVLQK